LTKPSHIWLATLSLLGVLAVWPGDTQAQPAPVAFIDLPPPGTDTALYDGWNNVSLTFVGATPVDVVAHAIEPESALDSIWRFDAPSQTWDGFDPDAPPAVNTLDSVNTGDIVLVRVHAVPGTVPTPTEEIDVELVAGDLAFPVSITFAPDGRLFYNEFATGQVRIIEDGALLPEPFAQLDIVNQGEAGLLGLVLHPDFDQNGFLYVYHTYETGEGLANRIVRLRAQGNQAADSNVILAGIPASGSHNGGILEFGPDGKLYASTGDAGNDDLAQEVASMAGKVLRLEPDGAIPEDNTLPGYAYSLGHRNVFGLAFRPQTGALYATENGPSGNDEVNVITSGGNYGWPVVAGTGGISGLTDPIAVYTPAIAPTGAAFYTGEMYPAQYRGNLFFGSYRGENVTRFVLAADGEIVFREALLNGEYGPILDVTTGPDGLLYFSTPTAIYRITQLGP
jgi:glucose/arabinose dehydrogenase